MRLIYAEDLKRAFDFDPDDEIRCDTIHYGIDHAKTIDAVEVVRCKDCRHKYLYNDVWLCRFGIKILGDDGYCSYGEKVSE